ncbi:MAG: carboxypeptidase-like regulatory domain-containing protein [Terracidiphilus sp.]
MTRRLHLAVLVGLIALGNLRLAAAGPGSVSGVVRDSAGIPQIGAEVQLLRPDLSVLATVYTNTAGHFDIPSVMPGRYSVKALGASFLPSLRDNVRVRANTVVNLTLNTLYEVMQWLPAEPRAANAQRDDWAWTLRSAANRPLLRWLEDGPLVVVTDGPGAQPRLKARLLATGQEGAFGESGERISASVEETPSNSRELLARVDFDPATDSGLESMLGFRQDLGYAGSVQSVAAVAVHPEIGAGNGEGLSEAALRTWETIRLGDELEAEVGAGQVLARLNARAQAATVAMLPFATVGWRKGKAEVSYRMTTSLPAPAGLDESAPVAWLPALAERDGRLTIEHGLHQEIGWSRLTTDSGISLLVYSDHLANPVVEAAGRLSAPEGGALTDSQSQLLRAAGPNFSTTGFSAVYEHRLPAGNHMRLSYANGDALVMPATAVRADSIGQAAAALRPRHAQMYALSLSGMLDGTGTRWRASYRWQPEETVTQVAPFAVDAAEPFMNLHLRQPIRLHREGIASVDALIDVRNLLAQGYQPYLLSDGSLLLFAQDQRSIRAGLAFSF